MPDPLRRNDDLDAAMRGGPLLPAGRPGPLRPGDSLLDTALGLTPPAFDPGRVPPPEQRRALPGIPGGVLRPAAPPPPPPPAPGPFPLGEYLAHHRAAAAGTLDPAGKGRLAQLRFALYRAAPPHLRAAGLPGLHAFALGLGGHGVPAPGAALPPREPRPGLPPTPDLDPHGLATTPHEPAALPAPFQMEPAPTPTYGVRPPPAAPKPRVIQWKPGVAPPVRPSKLARLVAEVRRMGSVRAPAGGAVDAFGTFFKGGAMMTGDGLTPGKPAPVRPAAPPPAVKPPSGLDRLRQLLARRRFGRAAEGDFRPLDAADLAEVLG